MKRKPQLSFLKNENLAYGGELLKTRKGRTKGRPLATKYSMHLVLRSTRAKGEWSFKKRKNELAIREIMKKFATKYGVRIISMANVGNHLHLHIKLSNRHGYKPFIRATTSAIVLKITGRNRWQKNLNVSENENSNDDKSQSKRFWDYRPFSRVVVSFKALLNLKDYIEINRFEGFGYTQDQARFLIGWEKASNTG